ncbi:hypothetical protein NQ317_004242 [Molorchus minor]|uniref:Uncharacterized protein n=1 Tax=Molorchus minor TaxID=1323400 RepID=A0ABQ9K149_9CUCU|nr:hypothetical protein NQ317_004242 [Molorchus minor]
MDVEFAINNSYCRSIGTSPSKLLFGVSQRDPNDELRNYIELENDKSNRDLNTLRDEAKLQMKNLMMIEVDLIVSLAEL